ncbi:DUF6414 family protein [Kutzneria chonburiensis]|uniref:DUF6414 family protein n=1 Tax=Kutzneria chonburiensis TaxID=1483604 RepID=UPI003B6375E8
MIQDFSPEQYDPKAAQALETMKRLNAMTGGSLVATGEVGEGHLKFAFKLDRGNLRAQLDALEGEAVVVGKVEKKWPQGKSYPLLTLPGLNLLNREARRKMEAESTNKAAAPGVADHSLEGPAATLSAIAIFR